MALSDAHGFETFEHTADIGIRAWGENETQLFEESARGLFSVIATPGNFAPYETRQIDLLAESGEELLFAWLRELLYLFDTEHLIFCKFQFLYLTETNLSCEVSGETLDLKKHELRHEVKAVTRHQFHLDRKDNQLVAEFILDI